MPSRTTSVPGFSSHQSLACRIDAQGEPDVGSSEVRIGASLLATLTRPAGETR